ncbi:MAG TPA: hypothetical protein VFS96_09720 [Nitrolancea sp.]|nr:hypothetical protein [Nitrolancea sp.]
MRGITDRDVLQSRCAGRATFVVRILVPGRPVISTRGYASREAARASARQLGPTARIVVIDMFTQERLRFRPQRHGECLARDFQSE